MGFSAPRSSTPPGLPEGRPDPPRRGTLGPPVRGIPERGTQFLNSRKKAKNEDDSLGHNRENRSASEESMLYEHDSKALVFMLTEEVVRALLSGALPSPTTPD